MTFKKQWPARAFTICRQGEAPYLIHAKGRDRWALQSLISQGRKGCTPIENPAPRWSAYIHKLRKLGVDIETVTETHDGPFAGHHARYVLACTVTPGREVGAHE